MNIVVIGAARGLGNVLSQMLAENGHRVIAGFRCDEPQLSEEFRKKGILTCQMDIGSEDSMKAAAAELLDKGIVIDAVVLSAGVLMPSDREHSLLTCDIEDLITAFRINAAGIIISLRSLYPLMRKNGLFIAVTSEGGSFSRTGIKFPEYGISKTAANKVVLSLRGTVEDLEVIALHPGRMNTDMGRTTAQIEPEEAAEGIMGILEKRIPIDTSKAWFIDYNGNPMAL